MLLDNIETERLVFRRVVIFLLSLFLTGCLGLNNEKPVKRLEMEFVSFNYKIIEKDVIEFARIIKDSISYRLIEGTISYENLATLQKITNQKAILKSEIDSIQIKLKAQGFNKGFDKYGKVIFVQLQPKTDIGLKILDLRNSIEYRIDDRLYNENLGEWFASDIGPGGANILFDVKDWNNSLKIILNILNSENLLDQSLVTKRIYTAKDDWHYEIVYPINYSGEFISM